MIRFITMALLLGAPTAAIADADWRVSLRGGMHIYEDQRFDFVSEDSLSGAGELALHVRVWEPLWVGLAFQSNETNDTVHADLDTEWLMSTLKATAMARWQPFELLGVYGRLGPAAARARLTVSDGGRTLEDVEWTVGGHAGLGIEFLPVHRSLIGFLDGDFAFGLSLEATYQRFAPVKLADKGATLGTLDPSGPGWLLGITAEW